ncbi:MAG TPA: tRNA (adenosine(37)-N6)-threonylcarbamoyltransferase complex dimerization subunit type 1 TsaB [Synergistetes bacterium]|nr:tRNA (adenosine(37)-N6)-threonylcarbamoyltransferase complex dimerization subunit type 1 TsaB [Synergistota bacterium]
MEKSEAGIEKDGIVLAVDTTTPAGGVALLRGKRLLAEINQDSADTFSERLLPSIQFVLRANRLKIQDVEGFAVAVGPGSFTGIRIGLSTVKSFAYASGRPVAAVSTLAALAHKLRHPSRRLICPLLDAKKNEIYGALFESKGNIVQEVIPQAAYSPDAFFSLLPAHRIIHFIGSGVDIHRLLLFQYFKDKARLSQRSPFIAYEVGLIGYDRLRQKKGLDAHHVEPLYLRKSQAEEKH